MRAMEIDYKWNYTYWKMFIKLTVSIYSFEVLLENWSIQLGFFSGLLFGFGFFVKNLFPQIHSCN